MIFEMAPNSKLILGDKYWINHGPGIVYLDIEGEVRATATEPTNLQFTEIVYNEID